MSGFVKLYSSILDSSVWGESAQVRLLWITLLAMADKDGEVMASVPGLARRANLNLMETLAALEVLTSPDPFDRSGVEEGRRLRVIQGGWQLVNYQAYRELRTEKQISDANRQARHRSRKDGADDEEKRDERDMSHLSREVSASASASAFQVLEEQNNKELSVVREAQEHLGEFLSQYVFGDYARDVEGLIRAQKSPISVIGVLLGHLTGIDGKPVDALVVGRAVREYLATGEPRFNPAFFAGFIRGVGRQANRKKSHDQGAQESKTIDREADNRRVVDAEEREGAALLREFKAAKPIDYAELERRAEASVPATAFGRDIMVRGALMTLVRREVNNASR